MKRLGIVLAFGLWVGATAHGYTETDQKGSPLKELSIETAGRSAFTVPEGYGRLVNVVVDASVHYLYFEDQAGTIRVVLIGPRGASSRSRTQLQLLSSDIYRIKRGSEADSS